MGKLLIISFYYLPYKGAGTQRLLGFKRYLKKYQREYLILAPQRNDDQYDDVVFVKLHGLTKKLAAIGIPRTSCHREKRRLWTVISAFVSKTLEFLSIPDRQIFWVPYAIRQSIKLIRTRGIESIYTTSPPESSHIIGAILKFLCKKQWIAEFRDTWVYDSLNPLIDSSKFRHKTDSLLERSIVKLADGIIVNSQVAENYFRTEYREFVSSKITTIHTGYQPSQRQPLKMTGKFNIVHTGTVYLSHYKRSITPFLKGLAWATERNTSLRKHAKIFFVGALTNQEKAQIYENRVKDIVEVVPFLEHDETIKYQQGADLLLLINHSSTKLSANIPSKLFEYIGAEKPILALTTEGAVTDLLRGFGGFVVKPCDHVEIGNMLLELYRLHRRNSLRSCIRIANTAEFTTEYAVKKLITFTDKVLDKQT